MASPAAAKNNKLMYGIVPPLFVEVQYNLITIYDNDVNPQYSIKVEYEGLRDKIPIWRVYIGGYYVYDDLSHGFMLTLKAAFKLARILTEYKAVGDGNTREHLKVKQISERFFYNGKLRKPKAQKALEDDFE